MRIDQSVPAAGGTGERVAREPLTGRVKVTRPPTRAQRTGRRERDPDPGTGPAAREALAS